MPRPAAERPLPASPARVVGETVAFNGNLDSHYTFNNFVEGRSNQLGRAAVSHAAQNPSERAHNPLLLYGGTGMGKTHLMFAAVNDMRRHHPGMRVLYDSCEPLFNARMKRHQ